MNKGYHKIPTLWKRSSERPFKILPGHFSSDELDMLQLVDWVGTEKIDGTNIRVYWDGHRVRFDGRTDNAQIPAPLFDRLTLLFGGEENAQMFEQVFGDVDVTLYGEGYGNKIQAAGRMYDAYNVDFTLFDVNVDGYWLSRKNVEDVASKLAIQVVPIVITGTLSELSAFVQNGFNSVYGDFPAEGIVARPRIDLFNRKGERIIVKLKCKDF